MDTSVVEEAVIVEVKPSSETKNDALNFAIAILFKCIDHIANLLEPLAVLWIQYYPRIFGNEAVIILPSPLNFTIIGLYAFTDQIKSQGSDFPFCTHPGSTNVAITSLIFYVLASVAQHLISSTGNGLTSVYATIAQLGSSGGPGGVQPVRSHGASDFMGLPFRTHPGSTNVAITSLNFYVLASVAQHLISSTGNGLTSVYATIAQLGTWKDRLFVHSGGIFSIFVISLIC